MVSQAHRIGQPPLTWNLLLSKSPQVEGEPHTNFDEFAYFLLRLRRRVVQRFDWLSPAHFRANAINGCLFGLARFARGGVIEALFLGKKIERAHVVRFGIKLRRAIDSSSAVCYLVT